MAEQELDSPQVLGALVDQRRLGPSPWSVASYGCHRPSNPTLLRHPSDARFGRIAESKHAVSSRHDSGKGTAQASNAPCRSTLQRLTWSAPSVQTEPDGA